MALSNIPKFYVYFNQERIKDFNKRWLKEEAPFDTLRCSGSGAMLNIRYRNCCLSTLKAAA